MIYLDNAATTRPSQAAINDITNILTNYWGNPSSPHSFGKKAKDKLEEARKIIADSINAEPDEIIFTSSATESNNMAIRCYYYGESFASEIEHPSIINTAHFTANYLNILEVDEFGFIKSNSDSSYVKWRPMYCIGMANSEIGTIQDIRSLAAEVHAQNGIIHVDATQAYGHIPIDVKELGIDSMSFSGHKFNVPKGIGVLYKKKNVILSPSLLHGGSQENGFRAGTENVAFAYALAQEIKNNPVSSSSVKYLQDLSSYTWGEIQRICADFCNVSLNGCPVLNNELVRLPGHLSVTFHGIDAQYLISMLDLNGIYVSAGSACSSGEAKPSHVLKAIGLSDEDALSTIRITLNKDNTKAEIDTFLKVLKKILSMS